jgi:hypothetical protein
MKWRMEKKKRRKEEYIWIRRSKAWLLASWSRFRFRVLHKATSGPWVAAAATDDDDDDDDYDDERLNCQQANSHCPYHIQHHPPWWFEPQVEENARQLRNTSHTLCWQNTNVWTFRSLWTVPSDSQGTIKETVFVWIWFECSSSTFLILGQSQFQFHRNKLIGWFVSVFLVSI